MQRLSRRFSGFVFLYIAIAQVLFQVLFNLGLFFTSDFFMADMTLFLLFFRFAIYLPPIIVIALRKYPFSGVLRINTFSAKQLLFAVGISFFLYLFVVIFRDMLNSLFSSFFMPDLFVHHSFFHAGGFGLWPFIITTCLVPAVLYELCFRGAVQSGFYGLSPLKACVITGALYGLMDVGIFDFLPYAVFGLALCYISIKTGSIIPGMITTFLFHLFRIINIGGLIYFNLLSPLGLSESVAAILLALVSLFISGLLLKTMPNTSGSSHPFVAADFKSFFANLKRFRQRLRLSWLPDPEAANAAMPKASGPRPSAAAELTVFPSDSDRQQKNTGFIAGSIILIVFTLLFFGFSIYSLASIAAQ